MAQFFRLRRYSLTHKRIPDTVLTEIRQQADIVEVISEYVALTKSGKNYKGLCPFHQEKTPSFVVSPEKKIFHCYGCGVGGNIFSFLVKHEKCSFPESVGMLAKRAGINMSDNTDTQGTQGTQQIEHKDQLYRLHKDVSEYFTTQLVSNHNATERLRQREVCAAAAQSFSLGYALPSWENIQKHFASKYPIDLLLESGLLIQRKNGNGYYDRFRDRIIIPITDDRGRVIAFGGRAVNDDLKYVNSSESPIFQKNRVLFGLSHAKQAIHQHGYVVIVEGYFDMIVPFSLGVQNIVATMGTALTQQHLRVLQRYTRNVVLMFDGDHAGITAVQRSLDLFLESGFTVTAAVLPKDIDPDKMIREMGVDQFKQCITQAHPLLDFIRGHIMAQYDLSRTDQRVACANKILATIVKIQNIPERNTQISKTAGLLQITDADKALLDEFRKGTRTGKPRVTIPVKTEIALPPLERFLVKALLKDKQLIKYVKHVGPATFSHTITRKVIEVLLFNETSECESRVLDHFHTADYQSYLTELFLQVDEVVDPETTVRDCLNRLQQQTARKRACKDTLRLQELQEQTDSVEFAALIQRKNKQLQEKRHQK